MKISNWKFDITYEGVWTFLNIIVKSTLSILLLVIATSTTTFPDFLKGLDMLRIPRLLVMLMSFMYRYIFVLIDEARRLMRARSLRYFGSRYKEQFRTMGYMIGVLFIRTFEARRENLQCDDYPRIQRRGAQRQTLQVFFYGYFIPGWYNRVVSLYCLWFG